MKRTAWWAGSMVLALAAGAAAAETNGPAAHPLAAAVRAQADVRWWAQVNRAALYADNGTESEWFHVDNDSMPSRFGVAGDLSPADTSISFAVSDLAKTGAKAAEDDVSYANALPQSLRCQK